MVNMYNYKLYFKKLNIWKYWKGFKVINNKMYDSNPKAKKVWKRSKLL